MKISETALALFRIVGVTLLGAAVILVGVGVLASARPVVFIMLAAVLAVAGTMFLMEARQATRRRGWVPADPTERARPDGRGSRTGGDSQRQSASSGDFFGGF